MVLLRSLLLLLGVLSVLLLGAVAPTMAAEAPPPCHEMSSVTSHDRAPSSPDKPIKSMGCCVACVAAPAIHPPARGEPVTRLTAPTPVARVLPTGRGLSPETGPPRA